MKEPIWLDQKDCLAIHGMMLAQHGGLAGVREAGLLEMAIAKPQHLYAYHSPSLPELAASYAAGVERPVAFCYLIGMSQVLMVNNQVLWRTPANPPCWALHWNCHVTDALTALTYSHSGSRSSQG